MLNRIQYKWLVAIAFVAGFFMDLMDVTIVNVAIPTLSKDFSVPYPTLEWVVTGYLLSLAIWIPASGWLGDRFGTKRIFLFALGMFTIGSALCSVAPTVQFLIGFRVLQGVGGGMMTPVGVTMLFRAFPPAERAQASSIISIAAAAAPAIGPTLGGYLSDFFGWRWIFLVNVPIGIATIFFSRRVLKENKVGDTGKFDFAGFFIAAIGLVLLLYALSNIPVRGPGSPDVILTGVAGLILLILLARVESKIKRPILTFPLFRDRLFRTSNAIMFFSFAMWIGFLFVLPLFLQQLLGLSAFESGLTTSPQAIGWLCMATVASRFYKRLKPRKMIIVGLTGATIMTALFMAFDITTNLWIIRLVLFLRGLTMAFAVIPIQAAVFTNITPEQTGRASSFFNTNRQVASSVGVAILGAILFELLVAGSSALTQLSAYHVAFAFAAGLGLIGIIFGLTVKDKDAEASFKTESP